MAMMSCPKCGFTQPADQYCASCGVDMKAWRPREKPFLTRVATNPLFQITLVVIVVGGGFAYMRQSKQQELAARVRAIEIARQAEEFDQGISEAQQSAPRAARATTNASTAQPQALAAAPPPPPPPPPNENFAAKSMALANRVRSLTDDSSASTSAATTGTAPARTGGAPSQASITYYEMSLTLANSLMQNATQQASEGPLAIGVVPDIEAKLKDQTLRSLDSASQALQVNQPGVIFKGTLDQSTNAKLGFTLDMNTVALDENGAQIQFDLTRTIRDVAGPNGVDEARFQPGEAFVVPKGSALVVVGLLPHKQLSETEATFYKGIAVLKPLTSTAFIGGQSEVVLVLEAK